MQLSKNYITPCQQVLYSPNLDDRQTLGRCYQQNQFEAVRLETNTTNNNTEVLLELIIILRFHDFENTIELHVFMGAIYQI